MLSIQAVRGLPRLSAPGNVLALSHSMGVRTQGQMGSADPPWKMDEKLKSENMQKRAVFYVCVIF